MNKIDISNYKASNFIAELEESVRQMDVLRSGNAEIKPTDISLSEFVQERYGLSYEEYLQKLGVNPHVSTISNLFTMPNQGIRWLVPEIIRSALYLGIKEAPFYPNIIASDQSVSGLQVIMPIVNQSEATPSRVNEAETIPLGNVSFGQKTVSIFKIGKGFKITDEVKNYVSIDVVSLFLRDFGVQLGYAMDDLALKVLRNGNMSDGSEAAPVIGIETPNTLVYKDLLRIWIRAARMGRNYRTMIGSEDTAMDLLDLPEFKERQQGTTQATLNLKTPVPNSADLYIHGSMDDSQLLLVDPRSALIKLTARQLMVESERIVSNQTSAIYASLTTGFSKMYLDAAVVLDTTEDFSDHGFPEYMNPDKYTQVSIEG